MKVYLAGPMRGKPEFNFPAFREAAARLRAQGHEVFSPAENDEATHGLDFAKNTTGDLKEITDCGFSLKDALCDDLTYILMYADAIAFLEDWEYSSGALAEWFTARALVAERKIKFMYPGTY